MFRDILGRLSKVGFDDVVTIQERHLTIRLDPNLLPQPIISENENSPQKSCSVPCVSRTSPSNPKQ